MQPGFYRADGTIQNRRHIRQGGVLEETQQNHLLVLLRQFFDTLAQLDERFMPGRRFSRGSFGGSNVFMPVVQFLRFGKRQAGQGNRTRTRPAHGFLIAMQQNRVELGRELAGSVVTRQAFPRFDQGFGNNVFRPAQVAGQCGGLAQKARLQRFEQTAKTVGVSCAGTSEKFRCGPRRKAVVSDDHLSINPHCRRKGSKNFGRAGSTWRSLKKTSNIERRTNCGRMPATDLMFSVRC